jgi:hypothetical protein
MNMQLREASIKAMKISLDCTQSLEFLEATYQETNQTGLDETIPEVIRGPLNRTMNCTPLSRQKIADLKVENPLT